MLVAVGVALDDRLDHDFTKPAVFDDRRGLTEMPA
jgi:hypothetical protein